MQPFFGNKSRIMGTKLADSICFLHMEYIALSNICKLLWPHPIPSWNFILRNGTKLATACAHKIQEKIPITGTVWSAPRSNWQCALPEKGMVLNSGHPPKEWCIEFWPPPEGMVPNFEPKNDLKKGQICVFGSFLGPNGPFRLFSHHILCPTGLMKE